MISRIRIEGNGRSAADVETQFLRFLDVIEGHVDSQASTGELFIQREQGEPEGPTAFSGRMLIYLNVSPDGEQTRTLVQPVASA